jgi:PKD repeat protein
MKRIIIVFLIAAMVNTGCEEVILPTASFKPSVYSCIVGESIYFKNRSTNALTFDWDFGDGNSSTEENPNHAYADTGQYTVRLFVTNNDGSDEISLDINVKYVPCWMPLANMITPRASHVAVILNNKMYVAGGITTQNEFEVYDFSTDTWETKADLPLGREYASGCALNDKVYFIGGWRSGNYTYDRLDEYDPLTDTWTSKSPMPTKRCAHFAIPISGKIYVVGGAMDWPNPVYYKTVEIYDPETDSWTTQDPQGTAENSDRWGYGSCIANGKIYFIGGTTASNAPPAGQTYSALQTVEVYDPLENTWTEKAYMPTARWGLVTAVVNNKIYAIGGASAYGDGSETCSVVEEYDPVTNTWIEVGEMPKGNLVPAACVKDNVIYIPGGGGISSDDPHISFYAYDPACLKEQE